MELALMILKIAQQLAPLLEPVAKDLIDKQIEPSALDWQKILGRSIAELEAQVDATAGEDQEGRV